jgi:site-specific DNA-methyltransferase (adenine-specific)
VTDNPAPKPYYADEHVRLYHGRMEEVMQHFGADEWADACITDPPYQETSLEWDRWVDNWPLIVSWHTNSLWCFGSMRMFTTRWGQFGGWKLAQDIVWEKHNGSGFAADRFKRVHELALHFYLGDWSQVHHDAVREKYHGRPKTITKRGPTEHTGVIGQGAYEETGQRLVRSVIRHASVRGSFHPTEKPAAVIDPLIRYSVPLGGLVLDPFAGSGSTLLTARSLGRRAIGIEAREDYCEAAAERLSVPDLFGAMA